MFKAYRYIIAVNSALARLGCSATAFRSEFRQLGQEHGMAQSLTPQEAAVMLVRSLGIGHQPDGWEAVARRWRANGKVRQAVWEGPSLLDLVRLKAARLEQGGCVVS